MKSTPEVWASVADLARLAGQLGSFGDIRITRVQPESVVEWEGELAEGRVRLEPTGSGTRVVLSAALRGTQTSVPPVPADPAVATAPPTLAGWHWGDGRLRATWRVLTRWLARSARPAPGDLGPDAPGAAFARAFEPAAVAPAPEHPPDLAEPEPEPEPERHAPVRRPSDRTTALDAATVLAVLEEALDHLGAAHHRPFSRWTTAPE